MTYEPGTQIRFTKKRGSRWWTVRASDERFIIATRKAPFTTDDLQYTVVDLTGWTSTYNGVRPGVVRSSLNTLGGGYDIEGDEDCRTMLAELNAGRWEISVRRVVAVYQIELKESA